MERATAGREVVVPRPESEALARRLGVTAMLLEVAEVVPVTRSVRRVRCTAPELEGLPFQPGQDLMLRFSPDGAPMVRRRYTIRRLDRAACLVDLDFVLHGDGPAARWAASARPGLVVEAIGPRGKVTLRPDVPVHLFVGDESFVPAASAMAEALPPDQRGVLVLEVQDAAEELPAPSVGPSTTLRWVHRGDRPVGDVDALRAAAGEAASDLEPGAAAAYVGGEQRVVSSIRQVLVGLGWPEDLIAAKSYWRSGRANAEHGEPLRD